MAVNKKNLVLDCPIAIIVARYLKNKHINTATQTEYFKTVEHTTQLNLVNILDHRTMKDLAWTPPDLITGGINSGGGGIKKMKWKITTT